MFINITIKENRGKCDITQYFETAKAQLGFMPALNCSETKKRDYFRGKGEKATHQ